MATNGKINGNGRTPFRLTALETTGLGVAEFASMATSMGVVAVLDKIAPKLTDAAIKTLAQLVFEPYLDYCEWGITKVCKLEECQPDKTLSRQQRAEQLARATVLFVPSLAASLGVKILMRRQMNNLLGIKPDLVPGAKPWQVWKLSRNEKFIVGFDESAHIGSLLLFNTKASKITDKMIRASNNMFTSLGFSKEKARDLSNLLMIWEVPNLIGFGAGTFGVYGKHKGWWTKGTQAGSHVEKLASQSLPPGTHSLPHS